MLATLVVSGHPNGTHYATFTSGAGCEVNGAGDITTLADCSAAAAALGLSDTTAEDDGKFAWTNVPPYCYLECCKDYESCAGSCSLKFNAAGTKYGRSTLLEHRRLRQLRSVAGHHLRLLRRLTRAASSSFIGDAGGVCLGWSLRLRPRRRSIFSLVGTPPSPFPNPCPSDTSDLGPRTPQ